MTALACPPLHGSHVREVDFPEGVFRLPSGGVLLRSRSAAAALGRARRLAGRHPLQIATVFLLEGQAFAVVDYEDGTPSLLFLTDHTPAELAAYGRAPTFGRRCRDTHV